MNEKFHNLSIEKQITIINAGFKVFSESPYKKSPVSEIAREAGISKALLFHYFRNKKELYLYLWNTAAEKTALYLQKYKVYETKDLFEMFRRNLKAKCSLTRIHPYIGEFTMRAYFEQEAEIEACIHVDFERLREEGIKKVLEQINRKLFREEIDLEFMYKEMILAADGYLHIAYVSGNSNIDKIEEGLEKLIQFWENVYLKDKRGI